MNFLAIYDSGMITSKGKETNLLTFLQVKFDFGTFYEQTITNFKFKLILDVGDFGCMHGLKISLRTETTILERLIDIKEKGSMKGFFEPSTSF